MSERILRGISAAPGVVAGEAVVLDGVGPVTDEVVPPERRRKELERARAALEAETQGLEQIASDLRKRGWRGDAEIVETGVLMANDPGLVARVEALVIEAGLAAPVALKTAADESADLLAGLDDETLAQRADDVRSLGRRAAAHALGTKLVAGGVLIAANLGPADVADLGLAASGAALAEGGVTAHAAIVARSLGVPMVVGLGPDVLHIKNGEEVVLDGDQGLLVRCPSAARVSGANDRANLRSQAREAARASRDDPAVTRDGHRVTVLTNAATTAEAIEGFEQGAEGIGLLRTELPFLDARAWPSLKQQTELLEPIVARVAAQPATVRLFDFGGDKTPPFLRGTNDRGIDLLLSAPETLKTQLSAIVDAGRDVEIRILIPMVSSGEQVRAVRDALAEILDGRRAPQVGAMIETPGAALGAAEIAKEVDFFSIGTNDLTQLALGLDREQSRSAPVTNVKVLRLIDATVRAAHAAGIPVDVCGEAASDPVAMAVLVGLGVDELSVAAARVGEVRRWIRELDFAACREGSKARLLDETADAAGKSV
ncbi:MAG TPA: putative PEP-binding protein [Candidatus Dormibacteraeota bacterium]